jgi:hypothetical protein
MTAAPQETPGWAWLLLPSLVTGLAALVGVLIGGWITNRNQRQERLHRRCQEQLGFYGALLGMRREILAKSVVRKRIQDLSRASYDDELKMAGDDPATKQKVRNERWPIFEDGLRYDEQQLKEQLIPLYREMLALWNKNMALAEPSTQEHYQVFVEFVEVWNRGLKKVLASDVILALDPKEEKLFPLYDELEKQVTRLREELKK